MASESIPRLRRAQAVGSRQSAELAQLLSSASSAVVLTGAGISVPSGIPDFRSPGTGLWEKVDPMEVAHIDAWRRDPDRFWEFYGQRFASLVDTKPNAAHEAVAELERRGLVRGVITQNIDRLHRMAGSERVVEVHGSIEWSRCMECGGRVALDRVVELLGSGEGAPECVACIAPLKPDVVLFGELLPDEAMAEAQALAAEADLMVCIGSSLTVYPVAGLPALTQANGGRVALVTEGETPYDREAAVKLDGDVVSELDALLAAI
ncbi:MAG: NAD-dependent deacylase [Actinomycetota bacterium]